MAIRGISSVINPRRRLLHIGLGAFRADFDKRTSTMLDALNNTTTYSWDKVNRPLGKTFADGRAYSYGWDGNSNRMLMTDPTGTTTWTYDPANRMTGQQDPTGITSGLAYDADSRMITRALSSIGTFTYAYDNANRNTKLTNPLSEVTTNTYDAGSRLSTRALAVPYGWGLANVTEIRPTKAHATFCGRGYLQRRLRKET